MQPPPAEQVAAEPPMTEARRLQRLVDSLCQKGVLTNLYSWELTNPVRESVKAIREELKGVTDTLPVGSKARAPVQRMDNASREMLQNPTVFPNGPGEYARPISKDLEMAIRDFRRVFAEATSQIITDYALTGNCSFDNR